MVLSPESNRFTASPELGFVIGAFLGDGSFVQDSDYHHFVKMAVRDFDLAEAFNKSLSVVLSRQVNKITRTRNDGNVYYEAKYSSQPLGLFLEQPLHQLAPFIESFPIDFLRGLFSADGCGCVTITHQKLSPVIFLSNTNLLLLQESAHLLESRFRIRSAINIAKLRGTLFEGMDRSFVLRKTAFLLRIGRFDDVCSFVKKIGFTIQRKQHRIEHAIRLIKTLGRLKAAEEWKSQYFKERNLWQKRETGMILSETAPRRGVRGGGPDHPKVGTAWSKMPIPGIEKKSCIGYTFSLVSCMISIFSHKIFPEAIAVKTILGP